VIKRHYQLIKDKLFELTRKHDNPPFVIELWINGFLFERQITIKFYRLYIEETGKQYIIRTRRSAEFYTDKFSKTGLTVNLYYFNGQKTFRLKKVQQLNYAYATKSKNRN